MKIICIEHNYPSQKGESGDAQHLGSRAKSGNTTATLASDAELTSVDEPVWFLRPDTALLRNNDPFYIPSFTHEVSYGCELVVRINRMGKAIGERFAPRYYNEVGLGIGFTANDLLQQVRREGLPWERCKTFDHSAAISPEFVSLQELGGDVQHLHFTLTVNGQPRQAGDTAQMLHKVDRIIAAVSQQMTLRIGDLIYTGTPAGSGTAIPGDNLRTTLEGHELLDFDIR